MKANHLATDQIFADQTIIIPNQSPAPAPAPAPTPAPAPEPIARPAPIPAPSPDDVYLLARLISAEAQGEPYLGQVAVGAVVVYRMRSSLFPNTLAGVIFEEWQFEPVSNGQIWREPTATALQAAREALAGSDPTGGALFFFNPMKAPSSFFWNWRFLIQIGSHYFFG